MVGDNKKRRNRIFTIVNIVRDCLQIICKVVIPLDGHDIIIRFHRNVSLGSFGINKTIK